MNLPIGIVDRLHSELPLRDIDAIAETLEILELPSDQYFIVGGANLVLRGIKRTTRDIDALCSDELFEELAANPDVKLKDPPKSAIAQGATNKTVWLEREGLSIPFTATTSMGDGYFPQSFEEYRDQVDIVEGFPCVNLEVVYQSKVALQRPYPSSDIYDIYAIRDSLEGRQIGPPMHSLDPLPLPTIPGPYFRS